MKTDHDITSPSKQGWLSRWWRALFAGGLTVFFAASIPVDGLPVFVLAVAFALDTATELVMVRRGRYFTSPVDGVRYALLNAISALFVLAAAAAFLLSVTDRAFWLTAGVIVAALNTSTLHFALTHPLQATPRTDATEDTPDSDG